LLENRTIDLYCREDQINFWLIGLSEALKEIRPNAFVLSVGRYFWRKLALMGTAKLSEYLLGDKAKKTQFKSFAKALVAFKRIAQSQQTQGTS